MSWTTLGGSTLTWDATTGTTVTWSGQTVPFIPPPWAALSSLVSTDDGVDFRVLANDQFPVYASDDRPILASDTEETP